MTSSRLLSARPGQQLTAREVEVVRLAANGLSNAEIGKRLHLAENTIKSHMQHASRKLGATGRAHVVSRALQMGVLTLRAPRTGSRPGGVEIGPQVAVQRVTRLLADWKQLPPPPPHATRHWWDQRLTQLAAAINQQERAA